MPVWSVFVRAGDEPLGGEDSLDALVEAVEAQDEALGASVAGGDKPSVFVSVEAVTSEDARAAAEQIAARALDAIGDPRETSAALVYDETGAVAYQDYSGG
jgi:hypothetical protein